MKFEFPNDSKDVPFSMRFRWCIERFYGRRLKLFNYKSKYFTRKDDEDN